MDETGAGARGLLLAIAIAMVACGGGDGDGGSVSTGLPSDQKLSELDGDDAAAACQALTDGVDRVLDGGELERITCTVQALIGSLSVGNDGQQQIDVAMCRDLTRRCLDGETISEEPLPIDLDFSEAVDCDDAEFSMETEHCEATVGEYEACLNAALSEFRRYARLIDCGALADPQNQTALSDGPQVASLSACESLAEQCPELDFGFGDQVAETPGQEEPPASGCENTCVFANDDECDDGGSGAETEFCTLGTDCADCGPR